MRSLTLARPHRRNDRARRGFTFMEILFAVMILGIGFIMIAAMFPAALRQTQANVEENQFNTLSHVAQLDMQNLAYTRDAGWSMQVPPPPATSTPPHLLDQLTGVVAGDANQPFEFDAGLPYTAGSPTQIQGTSSQNIGRPIVYSFHDARLQQLGGMNYDGTSTLNNPSGQVEYAGGQIPQLLWDLVRGNLISPDSRQYAWVPLWSRSKRMVKNQPAAAQSIQLFIFPVRSRNKPEYDPQASIVGSSPLKPNPACDVSYDPSNLDPVLVNIGYIPTNTSLAPNGVLSIPFIYQAGGGVVLQPVSPGQPGYQTCNPVSEGCYVVLSKHTAKPWFNGTIFRVGQEVTSDGTASSSGGQYWAVSEIHNLPTEAPYSVSSIKPTDIPDGQQNVYALVIGRGPNPADASQQSDTARQNLNPKLLPRIGTAQELGYYPCTVLVK